MADVVRLRPNLLHRGRITGEQKVAGGVKVVGSIVK
jgi:hypothetical protein